MTLACAGLLLATAPLRAITLYEAMGLAYYDNPTLAAARAELSVVDEGVAQALSGYRPSVTLNAESGYASVDNNLTQERPQEIWPSRVNLQVAQPLYRSGRTSSAVASAEALVLGQRNLLRSSEQRVLLSVVQAYADVWRDMTILALSVDNERRLQDNLTAVRALQAAGEATLTDLSQAEARLAGSVALRQEAEGALQVALAVFLEVVGVPANDVVRPPLFAEIPHSLEQLIDAAIDYEPQLEAARFFEQAAAMDVDRQFAELLPEIQLVGTAGYDEEQSFVGQKIMEGRVVVSLRVPLYEQGFQYSRTREAKKREVQRRLEVNEAQRRARQLAVRAWQNLGTARARITSLAEQVRANQVAVTGIKREFAVGVRTVIDILDAERDLVGSQIELTRAQREEAVASYEVMAAMGRLDALGIGLRVTPYDATADYRKTRDKWFGTGIDENTILLGRPIEETAVPPATAGASPATPAAPTPVPSGSGVPAPAPRGTAAPAPASPTRAGTGPTALEIEAEPYRRLATEASDGSFGR